MQCIRFVNYVKIQIQRELVKCLTCICYSDVIGQHQDWGWRLKLVCVVMCMACVCDTKLNRRCTREKTLQQTRNTKTKIPKNNCTVWGTMVTKLLSSTHTNPPPPHLYETDVCKTCLWKTNTDMYIWSCLWGPSYSNPQTKTWTWNLVWTTDPNPHCSMLV